MLCKLGFFFCDISLVSCCSSDCYRCCCIATWGLCVCTLMISLCVGLCVGCGLKKKLEREAADLFHAFQTVTFPIPNMRERGIEISALMNYSGTGFRIQYLVPAMAPVTIRSEYAAYPVQPVAPQYEAPAVNVQPLQSFASPGYAPPPSMTPPPDVTVHTPNAFCTNCGTKAGPGKKFCGSCGTAL